MHPTKVFEKKKTKQLKQEVNKRLVDRFGTKKPGNKQFTTTKHLT